MPTTEELIQDLRPARLGAVVLAMAEMVAPYGVVSPDIIEPAHFAEFSERLRASAAGQQDLSDFAAHCETFIEPFADDEPLDAGFFAFGALVSIYYACCALRGDEDGVLNAAKRFLDLTGAADDDGVGGFVSLS